MRIGLALVLLVGLGAVARADRAYCPTVQLESGGPEIDKTGTRPMPQITSLVLSTDDGLDMISMAGTFEPDVTRIRVATSGGYSFETTPKQLHVCSDSHVFRAHEHVTIVAYDKAGNASEPFESDVDVIDETAAVEEHHHHDHHGMDVLITIGAIVLAGMELVGLVLIGFARKKAPFSVAGEFLSPILAENVARGVARSYLIKFSVALAIVLALLGLHHPNIAILVAPFAVVWLFELFLTRLVIGQFDSKIQRLEKRELWIYINSSKLWAPYKIWEKASALPSAGLAKRD
jgi:hypothetical protein